MHSCFRIARFEKSNCDFAELRLTGSSEMVFSLGIWVKCDFSTRYIVQQAVKAKVTRSQNVKSKVLRSLGKRGRGAAAPRKIGQFRPKECSKIALVTGCPNQKNCANPMGQCPHTFNQHLNYGASKSCAHVCEQALPTK